MSQIEVVFFGCDGTLVDGGVTCSHAYVTVFREFGIHVDLGEIFTHFKDVKLYEIIDITSKEQGVTMIQADAGHVYCAEVAHLFDTKLGDIAGTSELLASINVPVYVVSNGLVGKTQHSLDKLDILYYFPEKLFSGCNIQRWKPDPTLVFRATKAMNVGVRNCILVNDSSTGTQSGIDVRTGVFYSYADPHSKSIVRPKVTIFTHLLQSPEL